MNARQPNNPPTVRDVVAALEAIADVNLSGDAAGYVRQAASLLRSLGEGGSGRSSIESGGSAIGATEAQCQSEVAKLFDIYDCELLDVQDAIADRADGDTSSDDAEWTVAMSAGHWRCLHDFLNRMRRALDAPPPSPLTEPTSAESGIGGAAGHALAGLPGGITPEMLAEHWLSEMICDHEARTDRAACCCGWVSAPQRSVGDAAKAWAVHALTETAVRGGGKGSSSIESAASVASGNLTARATPCQSEGGEP